MDLTSIIGLLLGTVGIVLGHAVEGGHLGSLFQPTAALIVFGGTFGATLMSNTMVDVRNALKYMKWAFEKDNENERRLVAETAVQMAKVARKESILSIEKNLKNLPSSYMKTVYRFMLDGVEPKILKEVFESELAVEEERVNKAAKVWMDAGGFAPTIGIIGAVLGLIHVMGNLTNTAELGKGIAVAFVATIYGVGSANIFFIPMANKIKTKLSSSMETKEMIIESACSILRGLNPFLVEEKMRAYSGYTSPSVDLDA